jgi:hypothetical protein
LIFPFLEDTVIGVECVFCWYWIADLCAQHSICFVLGHALYMKAIHGGKTKNNKIDSFSLFNPSCSLVRNSAYLLPLQCLAHLGSQILQGKRFLNELNTLV